MKKTENRTFYKIEGIRKLTEDVFLMRIERKDIVFIPGQYVYVGVPNSKEIRPYTIYSGIDDSYLEIIVRRVDHGVVSSELYSLNIGDFVEVSEAKGYFVLNDSEINSKKYLFIASGVGIAPFHSFARSYSRLNFTLIHGIRRVGEQYDAQEYVNSNYISCLSQEEKGSFKGYVTDYIRNFDLQADYIYICGNQEMVKETIQILKGKGVAAHMIRTEIFY